MSKHTVNITRGPTAVSKRRDQVPFGLVFAVKDRSGKLGTNYASIGANGRLYSINLGSRELASSSNPDKTVTLTGTWRMGVTMLPSYRQRKMLRSEVAVGEIFKVEGGTREYAHIGKIAKDKRGWLSVPLDNTDNHAVTKNGDSHVTVIGTFAMNASLTK
jgi:hypothetical protein